MRKIILPFLLFITTVIVSSFSGCTKIDIPINKEEETLIMIVPDKSSILDTEPVIITLKNATGPIKWDINSPFQGGYFVPSDGVKVIFSPPNINENCKIELEAIDNKGNRAFTTISIIDEGEPPSVGEIIINEIAWAGTLKSSYDEYIEILNTTDRDFYLNNWKIENAGGNGISITFSGYIKANTPFLISNYNPNSQKSAINTKSDFVTTKLALPNNKFGPYILENSQTEIYDIVGNGKNYIYGINSENIKSSMARYNIVGEQTTNWDPDSWYTEGVTINLSDSTMGTPGETNSNIAFGTNPNIDNAKGIIIKYYIDAKDEIGDDWVQIIITKSGDIKNFKITDLDGDDNSITNNESVTINEGEIITVVWGDNYFNSNNLYIIPDTNPTGTKDELVLLCSEILLDCLCYYSTSEVQFDDKEKIKEYGWEGNPIHSKYGTRKKINGNYIIELNEKSWNIDIEPNL